MTPRLADLGVEFPNLASHYMLSSWINKTTGQIIHGLSPYTAHHAVLSKHLGISYDIILDTVISLWQRSFTHPKTLKTWPDFAIETIECGRHYES